MKKNLTGNRKYKRRRIAAAAGAGLTAAAVLITAVLGRPIDAEAADTLIGVEKLRSEVKESGRDYTVLEVVPDKESAEIGYLFGGYEPILGEWDEETGEWSSWKDLLIKTNPEKRADFINGKKEELENYYKQAGFNTSKDELPVIASDEDYDETDKPTSGYEKITSSSETRDGWFVYKGDWSGTYQVRFEQAIFTGNSSEIAGFTVFEAGDPLYYKVNNSISISKWLDNNNKTIEDIGDDAFVYIKSEASGTEAFASPTGGRTWGAIKSSVNILSNEMSKEDVVDPDDDDETDDDDDTNTDDADGNDDDDDGDDTGDGDDNGDGDDDGNDDNGGGDDDGDDTDDGDDDNNDDDGDDNGSDDNGGNNGGGDNGSDSKDDKDEAGSDNTGNTKQGSGDGADTIANAAALSVNNISQGKWFKLALDDEENNADDGDDSDDNDGGDDNTDDGDDEDGTDNNGDDGDDNGDSDGSDDDETYADDPDSDDETSDDEESDDEENDEVESTYAASALNLDQLFFVEFVKLSVSEYISVAAGEYGDAYLYTVGTRSDDIVKSSNGMYTFVDFTEGSGETHMTYRLPGDTIYCKGTFTSNEWFKKYVINLDKGDYKDFNVKVLVYTPEELNEMDKLPNFDFLYLNSGIKNTAAADDNDDDDDSDSDDDSTGGSSSGSVNSGAEGVVYGEGNDLTADVARALYDTVLGKRRPCLVDGSILYVQGAGDSEGVSGGIVTNDDLKNTEIFKLSAMLCQEDFGSSNYGSLSQNKMIDGIVDDADKNFVVEHVYCRYGDGKDSIINNLFNVATIYEDGGDMSPGFQNVLDEILLENQYREADSSGNYKKLSTDITQAKAVRHIINYANRRKVETKKHIRVLEIQPAKADQSELTLKQLQQWAPGVESADITVMTTAEFIGKIEKLNENYDLIYIGTSKDHLNMRYWVGDTSYTGKPDEEHVPAGTVFNDFNMDGLIYYNIGDLRAASMMLAGQLDSEYWGARNDDIYQNNLYYYNYVRYGGNDITEEKKNALLSFLDGSYPIVVADDFFESPVTVYQNAEYRGCRVNLAEGEYDYNAMAAEGIPGANIDSVKVKEGYKVTIYNGWFFEDNADGNRFHISFDKDESDFSKLTFPGWDSRDPSWNKKANSIKVERISEDVPARTIDEDHIDNCTYMYEFVKEAMDKKYVNFYAWSDITDESELFKFYLNRPKVSLADVTVNGFMKEGSDIHYVEAGINDRYNLQYSFTIRNEGAASYSTRYQCKLYIDINSDGKFSEQEEIADVSLTQGGGNVSANDLYADRQYVLSREVPAGYKGLLPWKVEITQVDNPNIYTSVTGYSKLEGVEQELIKVVQIGRDTLDVGWFGYENEPLFDLGYEIETEGRAFHELVYGGEFGGETFEGIWKDYDIDVTFLTISEFEKRYYGGVYKEDDEDEETYHDPNPDYLNDFNMLILGFSDVYADFTVETNEDGTVGGPMGAVVDFVNSGKSVLFAHDTTSFFNYPRKNVNYPNGDGRGQTAESNGYGYPYNNDRNYTRTHGDYHFAYTLNKHLRNLVGMDRYGVLASATLRAGNALHEGSSGFDEVVSSRYDVAYKPKSGKTETVPEVHGYTYISINGKDEVHPNSDNGATGDRKDYNSWNLANTAQTSQTGDGVFHNYYTNIRYDQVFYKGNTSDYGEALNPRNGEIDNAYVTQVNKGQITEYPYKLKENFQVAETHGQYYQLDYTADDDGDGESDLVVWYCLDKRGDQETIYSQSPNDVRNNYYIYNKGNITYTGMGHRANDMNNRYTLEEAKLFINTIIAAYQAGIKDPYINVLKRGVPESEELKMMYRYYDMRGDAVSLDDEAATEDYEKVYFTVQDINFIKGTRQIATHVFYEADGGGETITVDGKDITVNRLADAMYDASNDSPVAADNLVSGGVYYILVPRSVLQQCEKENGLDIYFEAQTTLTTNTTKANVYVTDKVYAKLKVLQAYMFNLE